jgi:hypothetical protein
MWPLVANTEDVKVVDVSSVSAAVITTAMKNIAGVVAVVVYMYSD